MPMMFFITIELDADSAPGKLPDTSDLSIGQLLLVDCFNSVANGDALGVINCGEYFEASVY